MDVLAALLFTIIWAYSTNLDIIYTHKLNSSLDFLVIKKKKLFITPV